MPLSISLSFYYLEQALIAITEDTCLCVPTNFHFIEYDTIVKVITYKTRK